MLACSTWSSRQSAHSDLSRSERGLSLVFPTSSWAMPTLRAALCALWSPHGPFCAHRAKPGRFRTARRPQAGVSNSLGTGQGSGQTVTSSPPRQPRDDLDQRGTGQGQAEGGSSQDCQILPARADEASWAPGRQEPLPQRLPAR